MIPDKLLDLVINSHYNILAIYPYGSRVYQSTFIGSDHDYIMIVGNDKKITDRELRAQGVDVTVYTYNEFQEKLNNHDIDAIEVYSTTPLIFSKAMLPFIFVLDLAKLRKSISAKASNSWVKAKKKITLEDENTYIGVKSLFHSIRIILFGIQIAKNNAVVTFHEASYILRDLRYENVISWEHLNKEYKPLYNKLMTEFRQLAPKEINNES